MYRFLIVGCGYVGSAIGRSLSEKRQKVWGMVRSQDHAATLNQAGIMPYVCDLTRPETLQQLPAADFVVICPAPDKRDVKSYQAVYLKGIQNFLNAYAKQASPQLTIYVSSTGVYGNQGGEWVDEATEPMPDTDLAKVLLEAEKQILASPFSSVIFRLGGIYGPGRNQMETFRKKKMKIETEERWLNLIHIDDIAQTARALLNRTQPNSVYLGVDDEPVRRSVFLDWLSKHSGNSFPAVKRISQTDKIIGKRCRNQALKALGIQLKYPTFREGYGALLVPLDNRK